jgi:hypothetical protein
MLPRLRLRALSASPGQQPFVLTVRAAVLRGDAFEGTQEIDANGQKRRAQVTRWAFDGRLGGCHNQLKVAEASGMPSLHAARRRRIGRTPGARSNAVVTGVVYGDRHVPPR